MTMATEYPSTEKIVDIFSSSATPIEVCRRFVHDFPLAEGSPEGCSLGIVDNKSTLVSLAGYGRTPVDSSLQQDIWEDSPLSSSLRKAQPELFEWEESGQWVLIVPLILNRIPVGALITGLSDHQGDLLTKEARSLTLISHIGGFYLKGLNLHLAGITDTGSFDLTRQDKLTTRQLTILQLMAAGGTNAIISQKVLVSESTVRQETIKIYRALQVPGRQEAVAKAKLLGLIQTETFEAS